MKKWNWIIIIIFLMSVSVAIAVEECKGVIVPEEVPCIIFLEVNTSVRACNTIEAQFYNESISLYNQTMQEYNFFKCNATFNQTLPSTYTIFYSTQDSGSIIVQEDDSMSIAIVILCVGFGGLLIGLGVFILLKRYQDNNDHGSE